jgi:hypothetical protein
VDIVALSALDLTAADGGIHRLGGLWADKPVVTVFLRHFG